MFIFLCFTSRCVCECFCLFPCQFLYVSVSGPLLAARIGLPRLGFGAPRGPRSPDHTQTRFEGVGCTRARLHQTATRAPRTPGPGFTHVTGVPVYPGCAVYLGRRETGIPRISRATRVHRCTRDMCKQGALVCSGFGWSSGAAGSHRLSRESKAGEGGAAGPTDGLGVHVRVIRTSFW